MRYYFFPAPVLAIMLGRVVLACEGAAEYEDREEWFEAVGHVTTIDFACCDKLELLSDQYEADGVLFPDGDDFITFFSPNTFLNDGWGADPGFNDTFTVQLLQPQRWVAADFPGNLRFTLYLNGVEVYASSELGGAGFGFFGGLVSPVPFDGVVIDDRTLPPPFLDDLHFGGPEPGDANADGVVDVLDLIEVITSWGGCGEIYCSGDTDFNGIVNIVDLMTVILNWS